MIALRPPLATLLFENVERPWIWLVLLIVGGWLLFAGYRSLGQRWGRGGMVPALLALRGAGLLALVLALAQPTWTREIERVDPGRLAVVLDNSLSMTLADPSGKPRYALAREAVNQLRAGLQAGGSGPGMAVDLFDLNGTPLNGAIPEQPRLERTDLVRALTEAQARLRSKPLAGMVLLSDGMDNTGREDFHELADSPVPIHTVGFRSAPEAGRLDLAVKRVEAPERALVHNEIPVAVVVSKRAGPATRAAVTIRRGREEFASRQVSFGPGDAEQKVSLKLTPTQAGTFVFTASVSSAAGERQPANNRRHFPLRVEAEPIRVLYVEGFLRYEYKFLKGRLEDDPDVSLVAVVRRANPELLPGKGAGELITSERLKDFDVVILGDMEASYLGEAEYQALVRWVEQGHALLALGGYHSFGPDGFRATPLAAILPVVFADREPYQSEEPFVLKRTAEGERHPIFDVASSSGRDTALWDTAPPLLGASLVQRAKPGASVLAVNPSVVRDGKPAVAVATQRYGAGHTMVLTADTTWRWTRLPRALGQADTLYARFWSQALRWLAGRSREDKRPLLTVSTDHPDYEVGKPVTVRVVRQPGPDADLSAAEITAEVVYEGGKAVSVPLGNSSAEPNVFTGVFYPPAGGRYEVAASLSAAGKLLANQATEFLVQGPDLELADPGTNPASLQAIASLTGGLYLAIEDAGRLADKIESKERRIVQVRRTELGNSPGLFLFFLGAVTAEWLIRRKNHLV